MIFSRNVYAYFLCRLVCTCIHESDAELTCMCFSMAFYHMLCLRLLYVIVVTSNVYDAHARVCVRVCACGSFALFSAVEHV